MGISHEMCHGDVFLPQFSSWELFNNNYVRGHGYPVITEKLH